jgi:hypothetical protein
MSKNSISKYGILYIQEDDENSPWAEDRKDLDPSAQTSFIYNPAPGLHLEAHRKRLPVYRAKNQLLYLMERHQVPILILAVLRICGIFVRIRIRGSAPLNKGSGSDSGYGS